MIQVLNSKNELDRFSIVHSSQLIVACVNSNSEEKEDEMPLDNTKKGLCELLKAKGSTSKDASRSQLPLPPPFLFFLQLTHLPLPTLRGRGRRRWPRRGRWSLRRSGFLPSSKRPLRLKARRIRIWPRCAFRIQHRTLSWSWMGQPYHGTPPLGSLRKGMPTTLPKPWSCPSYCQGIWLC